MNKLLLVLAFVSVIILLSWGVKDEDPAVNVEWPEYLGGPDRNHYSPLTEINAANVNQLKVAWEYHTLDTGQLQCNPIVVKGVLYGMTASVQPFALNAATGQQLWRKANDKNAGALSTSRGVTYWEKDNDKRILYTNGEWLYAVNALTGEPIVSFGDRGRTSLKAGLGAAAKNKMVISNTPGTIFNHLIIMPLRVSEGNDAALGHIQAFNVITGKLAWVFHTIPYPGEYGYNTWPTNAYKNGEVGWAELAGHGQEYRDELIGSATSVCLFLHLALINNWQKDYCPFGFFHKNQMRLNP